MVLADELTAGARDLLARIVVPHQLVTAVAAHVVEGADGAVLVLVDDDRRAGADRGHLAGEVTALPGQLFDAPEVAARSSEDRLLLKLPVLGVDRVRVVDRRGTEFRPVLGPAAYSRLREKCHGDYLPGFFGVEFYAKGLQCHGHRDIAADREDEIHALPVIQVFAQRGPCRVGQFIGVHQFVDTDQDRAVELVVGLAPLDTLDVLLAESARRRPSGRAGIHSYAVRCDVRRAASRVRVPLPAAASGT